MSETNVRLIFADILRGYSEYNSKFGRVFVKHFTNLDLADLESKSESFSAIAKGQGLPTEEEKEQYLLENGLWTEEKNKEIKELNSFTERMKLTRAKMFRISEIQQIDKEIKESEAKVSMLKQEYGRLLGTTVESYTGKKNAEFYIFDGLYFDKELTKKAYTQEQFDEIDDEDLNAYFKLYDQHSGRFASKNLKKVALSSLFMNVYSICENNPHVFYGIPAVKLSFYQIEVFGYGRLFHHILSENRDKIPEDYLTDPEGLIEWYQGMKNAEEMMSKNKSEGGHQGIVGSKEDLKRLGIKKNELVDHKSMVGKSFEQIAAAQV